MTSFIDPDRVDHDKLVDSRFQEPFWERHRTAFIVAIAIYWLASAAFYGWLMFGVDPDADLPLWIIGVMLIAFIGLTLLPLYLLGIGLAWPG